MFNELMGSQPGKQRTWGRVVISLVLHVTLIYGAVEGSKAPPETTRGTRIDTFILPPVPRKTTPAPSLPAPRDGRVRDNPAPVGHQIVVAPDVIPDRIPPIEMTKQFDPADFTGRGLPDGIAAGSAGGGGRVDVPSGVWLEAELDVPPRVISAASPRYPPVLQDAGIEGRVVYQFVIDSTGRAEPGSFALKQSTYERFNQAAREAILKTVFEPGRKQGSAVRVLVVQRVSFHAGG